MQFPSLPATAGFAESLFAITPIGLQIFALDGTALRMNEANRRILGLPSLDVADGKYNLLRDPFARAAGSDQAFLRAAAGEIVQLSELQIPFGHSLNSWGIRRETLYCDYWLFPVYDGQSQIVAVVAALLDVTRRKEAEAKLQALNSRLEELAALRTAQLRAAVAELESEVYERRQVEASLRESEDRFRTIVEASLDGYILLECVRDAVGLAVDLRIVELNHRMEQMLRRPRHELQGRRLLGDLPDSTGARFLSLYLEVVTTGRAVQQRVDVPADRRSAGQYEMQVVKLGDGVAVSLRDVGARVAAEETRLRLERQLMEARRLESIGLLAGGIAHDFNNILTAVLGHAELAALEVAPNSPVAESLSAVAQGVRRAANLTSQLLSYAGRGRLVVGPVVLNQLIDELHDQFRAVLPASCSLHVTLAAELPAVSADAGQLRQLVMNLVANAAESFGEAGGPVFISTTALSLGRAGLDELQFGADLAEGLYVQLTVADRGEGMDSMTLTQIFTPFFSTKGHGRGLGLAAVQGTVRAHGGALKVESVPDAGTAVSVFLPASEAAPRLAGHGL